MKRMIALVLALMLALPVLCAAADTPDTQGMRPRDAYLAGAQAYENKEYADAAVYFEAAGNHADAQMWAFYCQAICLMMNDEATKREIARAQARFELLEAQSFQQAAQWVTYCKGRDFELDGIPPKAIENYATILVHDSLKRYLTCKGKSNLLESEDTLRARVARADQHLYGEAAYEIAMEYYEGEDYAEASAYFWLAGNYEDALLWRFFCQAIQLIVRDEGEPEATINEIKDAAIILDLLKAQGFEAAIPWSKYCEGREFETSVPPKALEIFKSILVYDSAIRYLRLKNVE